LIILTIVMSLGLMAQTNAEKHAIEQLAAEKSEQFNAEKEQAIAWAKERGYPVRFKTEAGNTIELMGLKNGFPQYYTTLNAEGATVIKTDRLYPGSDAGFSLTGAGIIMGIWDGGAARSTHQEFVVDGQSKIFYGDDSEWDDHGTHVAATMVAVGAEPAARGMSYEADLVSFDWNNNISEMLHATYYDFIRVSQHSY
jgi:subtilisin family serine protease